MLGDVCTDVCRLRFLTRTYITANTKTWNEDSGILTRYTYADNYTLKEGLFRMDYVPF